MVFDQSLLGPTPEPLQAVDVDLARREVLLVVHLQMSVAAEHEAVVAAELIRIDHAASADLFDGELEQRSSRYVRNDADMNPTFSLQDAEHRYFAGCAAASIALAPAPEVGLVEFDLTTQQTLGILGVAQDRHADRADGPVDGPIGQAQLQGHLTDRYF